MRHTRPRKASTRWINAVINKDCSDYADINFNLDPSEHIKIHYTEARVIAKWLLKFSKWNKERLE